MSTMTVSLIVLICTVLFGGLMVSRSYSEGFEEASGNKIPTSQPAQQVLAKPAPDIMVPSMQMQMQPSMYSMPMQMQPPMMEPVSLPFDAQILLPIQSPTFNQYRTTAAMQLQGAPYGQMAQMSQMPQMAQMAEMPANFTPKKIDEQTMLLDKAMQAALEGDMATAASLKKAASLIGRG
jgi:hypothetical protein